MGACVPLGSTHVDVQRTFFGALKHDDHHQRTQESLGNRPRPFSRSPDEWCRSRRGVRIARPRHTAGPTREPACRQAAFRRGASAIAGAQSTVAAHAFIANLHLPGLPGAGQSEHRPAGTLQLQARRQGAVGGGLQACVGAAGAAGATVVLASAFGDRTDEEKTGVDGQILALAAGPALAAAATNLLSDVVGAFRKGYLTQPEALRQTFRNYVAASAEDLRRRPPPHPGTDPHHRHDPEPAVCAG